MTGYSDSLRDIGPKRTRRGISVYPLSQFFLIDEPRLWKLCVLRCRIVTGMQADGRRSTHGANLSDFSDRGNRESQCISSRRLCHRCLTKRARAAGVSDSADHVPNSTARDAGRYEWLERQLLPTSNGAVPCLGLHTLMRMQRPLRSFSTDLFVCGSGVPRIPCVCSN